MQSDYEARFGGIARLYGAEGLARLRSAHVCVVGVGGVGSWSVEALARSGVGALTLIDLDEVCVSNVNRQLPALTSEVGNPKVRVLEGRIREINPECNVTVVEEFFTQGNAERLLGRGFTIVLDAIDHPGNKCELLARCRETKLPVVTVGGAGGRRDPTAIRMTDLALSTHDRLLQQVRRKLRKEHRFPENGAFGIQCVYSPEPPVYPRPDGSVCEARPEGMEPRMNCNSGYGSVTSVTGAFGFVAAAEVLQQITEPGNRQ